LSRLGGVRLDPTDAEAVRPADGPTVLARVGVGACRLVGGR
jgi:hypothetical protein